jgi:hypothetical protein
LEKEFVAPRYAMRAATPDEQKERRAKLAADFKDILGNPGKYHLKTVPLPKPEVEEEQPIASSSQAVVRRERTTPPAEVKPRRKPEEPIISPTTSVEELQEHGYNSHDKKPKRIRALEKRSPGWLWARYLSFWYVAFRTKRKLTDEQIHTFKMLTKDLSEIAAFGLEKRIKEFEEAGYGIHRL